MINKGEPVKVQRWLPVQNTHEEDVPPFGAMLVTGIDPATRRWLVTRPDQDSMGKNILINGPGTIPAGEHGAGTNDFPTAVYVSDTDGEAGDSYGTEADKWYISPGKLGFTVVPGGADPPDTLQCFFDRCRGDAPAPSLKCNDFTDLPSTLHGTVTAAPFSSLVGRTFTLAKSEDETQVSYAGQVDSTVWVDSTFHDCTWNIQFVFRCDKTNADAYWTAPFAGDFADGVDFSKVGACCIVKDFDPSPFYLVISDALFTVVITA